MLKFFQEPLTPSQPQMQSLSMPSTPPIKVESPTFHPSPGPPAPNMMGSNATCPPGMMNVQRQDSVQMQGDELAR